MTIDETRKVLESYWGGHDPEVLDEGAVFTDIGSGTEYEGRQAILAMLDFFYNGAFDASAAVTSSVIGEGKAVVEFEFTGTHIGEFAGIPAIGNKVQFPFAVAYDLEGGRILRGRIYLPTERLLEQIRA